ncbi:hypothetical protein DSO57_1034690 [Entomophthora muscae]|uniref:Uncharacterized protein n=1 Tax=Entomophthora muscae TaxID=34485 RepID=A0ACC2TM77_9FUNG|nr:hypothetical protein DSO57_1034690 [Entomophthora muscae]
MNHLIFSAVLTACLGIGGHQYSHQHGPYNKPPDEYFYKELAQLYSSETYSWPTLVSPRSTQHVAIYSFVFYMLTYFASNFGRFNVHAKVFRWMMIVYPILTALTGFQVTNLVPYLARILPHFMGLYTTSPTSDATGQNSQFLGVLYLVLTGLIDSALPAAGPWAVAGKALSYLLKLGPIIWWAMPVPASTPPSPTGAPRYSWYPDTFAN